MHPSADNTNKVHDKHSGPSLIFQTVFCILMREKKSELKAMRGEQWQCACYIFHPKQNDLL